MRHQCPACDVIFGSNHDATSAETLTEEYEWHYLAFDEVIHRGEIRAFRGLHLKVTVDT